MEAGHLSHLYTMFLRCYRENAFKYTFPKNAAITTQSKYLWPYYCRYPWVSETYAETTDNIM